jgi:enterochelin esterase-like enzyme
VTALRLESSDPALAPEGLQFLTVRSRALGQRADLTLFVPAAAAGQMDVPIVTLLHGVYGSHWAWAFKGGAHRTAARLVDAGVLPPMVLAMPSDGLWGDGSGYLPHAAQDFEHWIIDEVQAAVLQVVPCCSPRSPRFIAGYSMGGWGALRLAGKHPGLFRAVSAHSTMTLASQFDALVSQPRTGWSDAPADMSAWSALRQSSGSLPPLRLDCGVDDPFIEANRELHAQLTRAGIPHFYQEYPGGHDWSYWALHVEDTLRHFAAILAGSEAHE